MHPFRESRARMMGSTVVYVAKNATELLSSSVLNRNMDQLPNYLDIPFFRCTRRMLEYAPISGGEAQPNSECTVCADLGWRVSRWTSNRHPNPTPSWFAAQCVSPTAAAAT